MNIVDQEESDTVHLNGIGQSNEDKELMLNQTKPQYSRHFNHKIKLLKLLEQYTNRVIKALSYYCDICDFMTEETHTWNNHNKTEHPDIIDESIHYCTMCSMLILSNSFEEHYNTTEHCNLFKCVQSLYSVREGSIKNASLVSTVKGPSNQTSIIEDKNKQNKSSNIDIGEGN